MLSCHASQPGNTVEATEGHYPLSSSYLNLAGFLLCEVQVLTDALPSEIFFFLVGV